MHPGPRLVRFDPAMFADAEEIPCMHFLLNDKNELMHDNQLVMIARLVKARNIQFVASHFGGQAAEGTSGRRQYRTTAFADGQIVPD
ncbi:MAG: hypothetical protein JWM32_3119 [Verrucomicrobia bacterium]|nr:hypothetical protein [Verrucomicrobiota bacterium]